MQIVFTPTATPGPSTPRASTLATIGTVDRAAEQATSSQTAPRLAR